MLQFQCLPRNPAWTRFQATLGGKIKTLIAVDPAAASLQETDWHSDLPLELSDDKLKPLLYEERGTKANSMERGLSRGFVYYTAR